MHSISESIREAKERINIPAPAPSRRNARNGTGASLWPGSKAMSSSFQVMRIGEEFRQAWPTCHETRWRDRAGRGIAGWRGD